MQSNWHKEEGLIKRAWKMTLTRGSWEVKKVCAVSSAIVVTEYIAFGSCEWPHVLVFSLPTHLASRN